MEDNKTYNTNLAIRGDYIYWKPSKGNSIYFSIDGTNMIERVYANYNSDGHLVFSDRNGETHINGYINTDVGANSNTGDSMAANQNQKTYINVNNFSIEGKWKNIGSYTFGQVDNGGIVSFDGTYCNLYSPRDTYALTKDGDNYRLDTTSLLGEATAFTVKIVDKDHIDIYYGSNYLELARVG